MNPLLLLLFIFLPGLGLAPVLLRRRLPEIGWIALAGTLGLLWITLTSFLLALFAIPARPLVLWIIAASPLVILLTVPWSRHVLRRTLRLVDIHPWRLLFLAAVSAGFVFFFVTIHQELPTGDIQKSLFWAQEIQNTGGLPDYEQATRLNRDPSDFLTPGLHTLTAAVATATGDILRGTAWLSLFGGILLAGLAVALVSLVRGTPGVAFWTFALASLNLRFLRYVLYPGYHYQNLLGELFLFAGLWCMIVAIAERRQKHGLVSATGALLFFATIPLVHQFTAFLTALILPIVCVILLAIYRRQAFQWWQNQSVTQRTIIASALTMILAGTVLAGMRVGIKEKIADVFTSAPHLTGFVIPLADYPALLGTSFFLFGLGGTVFLCRGMRFLHVPTLVLLLWMIAFLLLGQGPFFFVDIPSARTIFYSVVPLAVCGGVLLAAAASGVQTLFPRSARVLAPLLCTIVLAPFGQSFAQQLDAVTHRTRVNATLTLPLFDLLAFVSEHPPTEPGQGILVDDWNRRRLTWMLLSPYHMLTRVGGDLRVIADEAGQSTVRRELYVHHLDFEKIFMAGNMPFTRELLDRHQIRFIATAAGISDDLFAHNPALERVTETEESVVYGIRPGTQRSEEPLAAFFLRPETLMNDVGDREDILPHSALSLATTRIGEPEIIGGKTVRRIDAPSVTFRINVGTYVRPLWDTDGNGRVDKELLFLLRAGATPFQAVLRTEHETLGTFAANAGATSNDLQIRIPPDTLSIDDKGFSSLIADVTSGQLVIDLVALGPQ